ncbi:hypothetical protein ACIQ8G_26360 [Streptomyces sp. NPDC094154]|uniref:hypothetical protein n=1 Tax=Streptomyces sp. NPDC094154 TaxID=3366059 RepID=UPI0038005E98
MEIAQRLGANPHVMPVLDFDPGYEWFVMPKADDNVEDRRLELQEPGQVTTARKALLDNADQTAAVVQALTRHAASDDWPTWPEADRAVWWLLDVARLAAREKKWALLDTAVQGMCDWDGRFDRWKP